MHVRVTSVNPPECINRRRRCSVRSLGRPLNKGSVSQSAVIEGRCGRYEAKGHRAHQLSTTARLEGVQSKDQMSRRRRRSPAPPPRLSPAEKRLGWKEKMFAGRLKVSQAKSLLHIEGLKGDARIFFFIITCWATSAISGVVGGAVVAIRHGVRVRLLRKVAPLLLMTCF